MPHILTVEKYEHFRDKNIGVAHDMGNNNTIYLQSVRGFSALSASGLAKISLVVMVREN